MGTVEVEERGTALWLFLNNSQRLNALDDGLIASLMEALTLAAEQRPQALVLSGRGEAFSAGGDLDTVLELTESDGPKRQKVVRRFLDAVDLIYGFPMPTIAAVNGDCVGAALGLVMASDLRLLKSGARMAAPFLRIGLSGADGGLSYLLPHRAPASVTPLLLQMAFLSSERSYELGLVHEVVPSADWDKTVEKMTVKMADLPSVGLTATKTALRLSSDSSWREALDLEEKLQTDCLADPKIAGLVAELQKSMK